MKKLTLLALGLILACSISTVQAQTTPAAQKIGYADVEYIFSQMPEAKQIESELKVTETQLANQINAKTQELQKKYEDYVANEKTMLEAVRANTARELEMLQQNLESLKQDAQTTYQKKHAQLLEPVYTKMATNIEKVAKENGFTLVLSARLSGQDVVLFADDQVDVSDLVLKSMGITPAPIANAEKK